MTLNELRASSKAALTVTEVAAGTNPEVAIPLLLLAMSDLLAAGARLGAVVDVVPSERFEPDVGPDDDLDPLGAALENLFEGIDEYAEVEDPVLEPKVVTSSISSDLVTIAAARFITGSQSGSVMSVTSTSPGCTSVMSRGDLTMRARPLPMR